MNFSLMSVQNITARLEAGGIEYASGGSGLLYSLGLAEAVRDWDLMTDAPLQSVAEALQGIAWTTVQSGDYPFASSYRLSIHDDALPLDVFGGFAIHSSAGLCRFPARSSFVWESIRMGSPELWAVAYALMERKEKARLLFAYLHRHGASREMVELMLNEPLPQPIREELQRLLPRCTKK